MALPYSYYYLIMQDSIIKILHKEEIRQKSGINLIASENYVPEDVRALVGSVLMNKYVEGNVGARYYSGCQFVDVIEQETINRFKDLFKVDHANVQPHAGSQANFAVYTALLNPGDTILSMKLSDGGHLSHGSGVNLAGKLYNIVSYGVNAQTQLLDYDQLALLAHHHKPKLIIAGASSYPRIIDFEKIALIAQQVGAYFMADIAHIAGLVVAGQHPSPALCADVITLTTHKTFRGPRGAVILCKKDLAQKIDRAVMPGTQGGAFMHEIAAKGLAASHAATAEFAAYQKQVRKNAHVLADFFVQKNYRVISGGTDTHLLLLDVRPLNLTGAQAEQMLESVDVFVNRNAIPGDTLSPRIAGGIRLGTAAITTRGATEHDMRTIAQIVDQVLCSSPQSLDIQTVKAQVSQITSEWR
jgi:glycine hydroxymethyltransferase